MQERERERERERETERERERETHTHTHTHTVFSVSGRPSDQRSPDGGPATRGGLSCSRRVDCLGRLAPGA